MGQTTAEVSYPGTQKVTISLSKSHVWTELHHSWAVWNLTPKECSIRVKQGHGVCPSRQMNCYQLSGLEGPEVTRRGQEPGARGHSSIRAPALPSITLPRMRAVWISAFARAPPSARGALPASCTPLPPSTANQLTCGPGPFTATTSVAFVTTYLGNK